jgi:hypothetical protein
MTLSATIEHRPEGNQCARYFYGHRAAKAISFVFTSFTGTLLVFKVDAVAEITLALSTTARVFKT